MQYNNLSEKDIAVLEDAKSLATSYRESVKRLESKFKGALIIRESNGSQYLYKKTGKVEKSLGRLDKYPVDIIEQYKKEKNELIQKIDSLATRIKSQAVLVKETQISKVQSYVAKNIRTANQLNDLVVVGTNALYAYESKFGVSLEASSLVTMDLDLFIDSRKSLSLVFKGVKSKKSILQQFEKQDKSFKLKNGNNSFSIENSDGFVIDFITQAKRPEHFKNKNIDLSEDDVQPSPISNLHWLINGYKIIEEVVFDTSGMPLFIKTPEPMAFAVYKLWLANERASNPKSLKDKQQAYSLIQLLTDRGIVFDENSLKGFPSKVMKEAIQVSKEMKSTQESADEPDFDFLKM